MWHNNDTNDHNVSTYFTRFVVEFYVSAVNFTELEYKNVGKLPGNEKENFLSHNF